MTVLAELGGPAEHRVDGPARGWAHPPGDRLNVVAVSCVADPDAPVRGEVPGLPDDAFDHDGQLTKREVRAATLAHLAPRPGELLWDVGAGNGSIGIEWLRAHRTCRALAVERDAARADRIAPNAAALGVPGLQVVRGRAPDALAGLPAPDVVFIGGGITESGRARRLLGGAAAGGRLVANAVTLEAEAVLVAARDRARRRSHPDRGVPRGPARRFHGLAPGDAGDDLEHHEGRDVTVHFIGAGPGAVDLLTLRARDLIAASPVCLYAGTYVRRRCSTCARRRRGGSTPRT